MGDTLLDRLIEPGLVDWPALFLIDQHRAERFAARQATGVRDQYAVGAVLHGGFLPMLVSGKAIVADLSHGAGKAHSVNAQVTRFSSWRLPVGFAALSPPYDLSTRQAGTTVSRAR
jgi:hypothetical protein